MYSSSIVLPDGFSISTELRAAAFLRRGDSSTDPFDRFRNYYLAVDAVGKTLRATGKDSTRIRDTIARVASSDVILELDSRLRTTLSSSSSPTANPVEAAQALNDG